MYNRRMHLVDLLAALSDRTRLRVLSLLRRGELCVCYFVEILDETQPKISRHLAYLRRLGLVHARREGKWIHYSLAQPDQKELATVLEATLEAARTDDDVQRDIKSLESACCASTLPASLENAPRPNLR